jgi:predicted PurR-regulated permease PerM
MTPARWRVVLWIAVIAAICLLVRVAWHELIPFFFGGAIAYALLPIVDFVTNAIPVRNEPIRRGLAVAFVYAVFGGLLIVALSFLVPIVSDQIVNFVHTLPRRVDAAQGTINGILADYRGRIPEGAQAQFDTYTHNLTDMVVGALAASARRSFSIATGTLSVLFGYFVIPFWMFYAMRDRYTLSAGFKRAVPPVFHDDITYVFRMADHIVGRYIRGQLLLALILGTAVGIGLTLLHVQLSLGLGVWAGASELVPILGPWIAAIPALLIVMGTAPHLLLPVFLLFFVVQNTESHLLIPRVQGRATEVPAALVILLLVISGAAFGFFGLVVAVPGAAILREIFWYVDRRLSGATPDEAFALSRAARASQSAAEVERSRARRIADTLQTLAGRGK